MALQSIVSQRRINASIGGDRSMFVNSSVRVGIFIATYSSNVGQHTYLGERVNIESPSDSLPLI